MPSLRKRRMHSLLVVLVVAMRGMALMFGLRELLLRSRVLLLRRRLRRRGFISEQRSQFLGHIETPSFAIPFKLFVFNSR